MDLSKNELKLLSILWHAGKPMTCRDVMEVIDDVSLTEQSVHMVINKLLSKGAVQECGFVKRGRNWAREFSPSLSFEQYIFHLLSPVDDILDYKLLLKKILEMSQPDISRVVELQAFFDQIRNEKG